MQHRIAHLGAHWTMAQCLNCTAILLSVLSSNKRPKPVAVRVVEAWRRVNVAAGAGAGRAHPRAMEQDSPRSISLGLWEKGPAAHKPLSIVRT